MKNYMPQLQRDGYFGEYSTEYDYNIEDIPSYKLPSREIRLTWLRSFGLAYWRDDYSSVWHPVVKSTINMVLLFVRIQIIIR
jgi:hypothetical protein